MEEQQYKNPLKKIIIILAVLLALTVAALAGTRIYKSKIAQEQGSVEVYDNIITEESEETIQTEKTQTTEDSYTKTEHNHNVVQNHTSTEKQEVDIRLHKRNTGDNKPFEVGNMFPGDKITKNYCVQVSYQGEATVNFGIDIRPGYEKLAEVLNCKVVLLTTMETLYDGTMADMPKNLKYKCSSTEKTTDELYYQITAGLDTSVGNEYQNKTLIADFEWWIAAEDVPNLTPPNTGDISNMYLWIGCMVVSALLMVIIILKRKREEADEN